MFDAMRQKKGEGVEVKDWSYEEFPEFAEPVAGARHVATTGREMGVGYRPDVVYATRETGDLHLQVLVPSTRELRFARKGEASCAQAALAKGFPCLVYVQGSAWKAQDCYRDLPQLAQLARRGFVVAVVEYRDSSQASYPAQIHDAQRAVRFVHDHAEELDVDAEQIFVGGNSSGGHTAVFSLLIPDEQGDMLQDVAPVRGVIDWYGAVSLMREDGYPTTFEHGLPTSPEGMMMGGVNLRERPELRAEGTATTHISPETPLCPILIVHGTKDRTVGTVNSVDLYRHLRACGHAVELVLVDGADHGGTEFFMPELVDIYERFMRECAAEA